MTLQSAATTAGASRDLGEMARLDPLVTAARQDLMIAEATTTALRSALATVEREQEEAARVAQDARQLAEATRVMNDAMAADDRAQDAIQEHLAATWACIGAAQAAFGQAVEWERKSGQERQRAVNARALLAGDQPHRAARPNAASHLLESDPAIRALMAWRR